jgi:hypothetical protein
VLLLWKYGIPGKEIHSNGTLWMQTKLFVLKASISGKEEPLSNRIWGSHIGDYEQFYLLRYNAAQSVENQRMFRRNIPPPSSGWKNEPVRNQHEARSQPAWFILGPWIWKRHVPPKRRVIFNGLHGDMSQKKDLFIIKYSGNLSDQVIYS